MLHLHTVEPGTLGLLNNLMTESDLSPFTLVGGTALSLQIGHRKSFDLDLFGFPEVLDIPKIASLLMDYGELEQLTASRNIYSVKVSGIKVDFVRYQYAWLSEVQIQQNIRFAGLEDIAAMKLSAITGRGRKRDFTDLYFLLKQFSLAQILAFYEKKYPDGNRFLVMKSLLYFADAEEDENPVLLEAVDWTTVQKTIEEEVRKLYV
ncbi:MAG: nucleotidyl transferase AbiEii/AbiGii toxin family protein [Saprospiraceae bacterium]|nr:nucleotidyl transferase AbiEii/AbiGii toxin family protein [Saprospiraceae bacterium]